MGFEQWSWDAILLSLDEDINPLNVPRLKGCDLNLAGWEINDHYAIIGVQLHNPVDMTKRQRESQLDDTELLPCFLVRGQFEPENADTDADARSHEHAVGQHA